MAKTKTRRPGNKPATADVDELLGELPREELTHAVANPLAPNFVPKPAPTAELPIKRLSFELPLAQFRPEVRQFSHVEARLTPAQGRVLRRLFDALDRDHLRMANGQHVASAADCVRWLLDQFSERAE